MEHQKNAQAGEIVLYQPDSTIQLEVKLDIERDTVWLTQQQMSLLFGRDVSVISRHISKIIAEGEINPKSNLQKMQFANSDKPVEFYDLDVIISVGYRVHSPQGILFRRWATSVLREHLLRGYSVNRQLVAMQERTDERFSQIQQRLDDQQQKVDFLVMTHTKPDAALFPNGCVFDAWTHLSGLVRKAENRIILIDNYCDERTLTLLAKRKEGVDALIYTRYSTAFETDLNKHNVQYPDTPIRFAQLTHQEHDRFLIIDDDVYIIGDSLKNLGHSLTAILKTSFTPEQILSALK